MSQVLHSSCLLHREVIIGSEPVRLVSSISPENVAPLVWLKIPRGNQNDVALSYPNSPFHFTSNSANAFFAVLTFNSKPVESKQFRHYADHVCCSRQHHRLCFIFAEDFLFTQRSHVPNVSLHTRENGTSLNTLTKPLHFNDLRVGNAGDV